jgi:[ribosomal protein S5]-alanine N-acetyltransferase
VIETSRLILRPVCRDDAESIFAYSSDEETTRYVTYDTYRSMDDAYVSLDRFFLNRDPET